MIVGKNVKDLRLKKGLSQSHIFKNSNLSRNYLHKLENAQGNPSERVIMLLADTLGVPAFYLLMTKEERFVFGIELD